VRRRGPGLAFVMTADVADVAASHPDVIAP
jgi:hypothetical protein